MDIQELAYNEQRAEIQNYYSEINQFNQYDRD